MDDEERVLTERLRERGLRVTPQRLIAYRALRSLNRHVTADELLAAVVAEFPGVALATIYTILDLFEELGLVRRIVTVGGTAIYDPIRDAHHHTLCTGCGAMADLIVNVDLGAALRTAAMAGFVASEMDVVLRGLCRHCSPARAAADAELARMVSPVLASVSAAAK